MHKINRVTLCNGSSASGCLHVCWTATRKHAHLLQDLLFIDYNLVIVTDDFAGLSFHLLRLPPEKMHYSETLDLTLLL